MKSFLLAILAVACSLVTRADPPAFQPAKPPTVVFIVDSTGSMMAKLDLVRVDVRQRVSSLSNGQLFHVLFYRNDLVLGLQKPLIVASDATKADMLKYIDTRAAGGPGDPVMAIQVAVALHADVIYWISDGVVGDEAEDAELFAKIKAANPKKIKINTVLYEADDTFGADLMAKVAAAFSGMCTDGEGKAVTPRPPPPPPRHELRR